MSKLGETVVNVNDVSRIAEGVVLKGDMISPSDIRIDGTVEGTLKSEGRIVVGEAAIIKGSIFCNILDFWGKLEGDIYVKDTLSLKSGSSVVGGIHVNRFEVELGAKLDGSCSMITPEDYDKLAK